MVDFVKVMFPVKRGVLIDGASNGTTNKTLQINGGHHRFALSGMADYTPPFVDRAVTGTTQFFPMIVQFFPLAFTTAVDASAGAPIGVAESSVAAAAPESPAPRSRARKKTAKKRSASKKRASSKKTTKKTTRKTSKKRTRKGAKGGGR